MKTIFKKFGRVIGHVLFVAIKFTVQSMLKFDRKVLKRHFNLETPLYKMWWNSHAKSMQRKLDKCRIAA